MLVAFDNLTDYGTNYLFLQHVMSMDTTFPGNALMYRSITNPVLWQIAYALIIAAEALTGLLFLAGAIRLFQVRNAPGAAFNDAKALVIAGASLAFLVWFFGFMVVAGEWFAMWQSGHLERPGGGLPLLHGGARRPHLRQFARRRSRRPAASGPRAASGAD